MTLTKGKVNGKFSNKGRPRVDVDINKILKLYVEKRFTVRQVARVVGVSHTTVARRIAEEKGQLRSWRMPGEA